MEHGVGEGNTVRSQVRERGGPRSRTALCVSKEVVHYPVG